jgi:lysophospholipase L1-like esterase
MSGPDRSWTIAPALLWFTGCLVIALYVLDGGVQALADRFTVPREPGGAPVAGPAFAGAAHEAGEAEELTSPPPVVAPLLPTDRSKILALEDVCVEPAGDACRRWGMDGFYRALQDARRGALGRALRVSWYGDSVIAADAAPGRLRALLQAELGDGGPGFVYVAPPHRFCGHEAVTRTTTGTWNVHSIATTQVADGLYGVGGSTADTFDGARATIKLNAGTASRAELYYLAQPRGGTVTLTADGATLATVATVADAKLAGFAAARVEGGARKFEIATAGKVRLFGIDLANDRGAVVDNFGVVSASIKSFAAHDAAHFHTQLAHRGADLVMIMIGANEARWLGASEREGRAYAASYEKLLAELRRARPDAACLVISPTDQAEAKDDGYVSRPVIATLVRAQRAAARSQGCAFYSTYDWMGGKGSAVKWVRKGLIGTDFAHLSRKGSNRLAESLFGTVMAGYQAYAR